MSGDVLVRAFCERPGVRFHPNDSTSTCMSARPWAGLRVMATGRSDGLHHATAPSSRSRWRALERGLPARTLSFLGLRLHGRFPPKASAWKEPPRRSLRFRKRADADPTGPRREPAPDGHGTCPRTCWAGRAHFGYCQTPTVLRRLWRVDSTMLRVVWKQWQRYSVTGCGTDFLQCKWAEMDRAAGEVAA